MFMLFSTRSELKTFLGKLKNWRSWLKNVRNCHDRVCVGTLNDNEPLTDEEIEELMED